MTEKGLADVIAAQTSISDIDGHLGRLWYVGYDINDLVEHSSFEEVTYLLQNLELPTETELKETLEFLVEERHISKFRQELMVTLAEKSSPMSMLRTAVSAASAYDRDGWDTSPEGYYRKAMRLIATTPTLISTYERFRTGAGVMPMRPELSLAANFLWQLTGKVPDPLEARIMDGTMILYADHTMNASTFTARVIASTLSDIFSAVTGAIAALKGPLHGGANEEAMHLLETIGSPENAERYIKDELLANHKLIMGFGHRVYKTEDPRATWLRRWSEQLGKLKGETKWYEISRAVEKVVIDEKGLYPNVDFYAASVYHYLGIPTDLMTPIFAMARMAGWTAHIREQHFDNRIIRPDSEYIGPRDQHWVPIEER
ncbi:MAG: citrate/2-methylcitrate synthase [Actinomycetota bacterium]